MSAATAPCADCGDEIDEINVEAFELYGKLLCPDCAEARFEEDAHS